MWKYEWDMILIHNKQFFRFHVFLVTTFSVIRRIIYIKYSKYRLCDKIKNSSPNRFFFQHFYYLIILFRQTFDDDHVAR